MPVYNGEPFLRLSLDSLLAQTFTDFEIILINDCSTDQSPVIMQEYANKDSRIKIFHNEVNMGLTKSLNKAIRVSSGEYIARMDAGDTSEKTRFEKQVAFLDSHPDYGLVGSWAYIIDTDSKKMGAMQWEVSDEGIRKSLIKYNPIVHSSIVVRKNILEQAGCYNEEWKYAQDYELYFRIIKLGKVKNLPEDLVSYRMMPTSITFTKNKKQAMFAVRARWKAIQERQFPFWTVIYLARPLIGCWLPASIKRGLKEFE